MNLPHRMSWGVVDLIVSLGIISTAQADLLSYRFNIDLAEPSWTESIELPQFDPALGQLTAVEAALEGTVKADVGLEITAGGPAVITAMVQSNIELQNPDSSVLLTLTPQASTETPLGAADGVLDYAGTSGITMLGAFDTRSSSTSPALAPYIGTGVLNLPILASVPIETISQGGGKVLSSLFIDEAGATVTFDYTFIAIPEPSEWFTLSLGIGLLCAAACKRHAVAR